MSLFLSLSFSLPFFTLRLLLFYDDVVAAVVIVALDLGRRAEEGGNVGMKECATNEVTTRWEEDT